MHSQSNQYLSNRHLSSNKDHKPRLKHIHKLSDTILQTSFLHPRKTQRQSYKSPHQFIDSKRQKHEYYEKHTDIRNFRPSMYERGEIEAKRKYITSNYVANFEVAEMKRDREWEREREQEMGMKSPRTYDLESSKPMLSKRLSQPEPYLSYSMVEQNNNPNNRTYIPKYPQHSNFNTYKSPKRQQHRIPPQDDILKRIKNYLSPRRKQEESFVGGQNSTVSSKYSVGSTMESNKVKGTRGGYDSPSYLGKMKGNGIETGFRKKEKEVGSPLGRDSREGNGKDWGSRTPVPTTSKFIYHNISFHNPSPRSKQQKFPTIKDFQILNIMGQGHSGVVHKAIHKLTGAIFALKKIPKDTIKKNSEQRQLLLEIKYQMFFTHPNIIKLYGVFDDKDHLYLILEFMEEGTLFQNLQKRLQLLSEKQVSFRVKQVSSSISYLQDMDVLHRDIKPQNIVLSHNIGKLCDFGWVTKCQDRRNTFCGTYAYAAPEILEGKAYDRSVDVWCIGMLAYELLTGAIAFAKKEGDSGMGLIFPTWVSKKARNFVEGVLRKDPRARVGIEQLLGHPFLIDE